MSTIDLLTRVNGIIKKFEQYDSEKLKGAADVASHDHFLKLYTTLQEDINEALKKSAEAEIEKNRAVVATLNAEVRRAKAAIRKELPKLQNLATRKVKGVKAEDITTRPDMILALTAKLEEIPDGVTIGRSRGPVKGLPFEIKIDNVNPEDIMRSGPKQHSEESRKFRDEFELRQKKQDEGLQVIEDGITTLKNMAEDIGEVTPYTLVNEGGIPSSLTQELSRQDPLVDEVDSKVNKASTDMKSTNSRLKETVTAMRSSRNFCVDIILLVIILGIAAYLYKVLKK